MDEPSLEVRRNRIRWGAALFMLLALVALFMAMNPGEAPLSPSPYRLRYRWLFQLFGEWSYSVLWLMVALAAFGLSVWLWRLCAHRPDFVHIPLVNVYSPVPWKVTGLKLLKHVLICGAVSLGLVAVWPNAPGLLLALGFTFFYSLRFTLRDLVDGYLKRPSAIRAARNRAEAQMRTPAFKRRMALAHEVFWSHPKIPSDELVASTEMRMLRVSVAASETDPSRFTVKVHNRGRTSLEHFVIDLQHILTDADSFGLDSTHMPRDQQFKGQGVVTIDRLDGGQTTGVELVGYGPPAQYRGQRWRFAKVLPHPVRQVRVPKWCDVRVDLPNARRS